MTRLALYLQDAHPMADAIAHTQYAEERGFEAVWQADSRLVREAGVAMAAFGATTQEIKIGSGVIDVWTRNPARLASLFATLDDLVSKLGGSDQPMSLTVAGHTDSSGNQSYNDQLSKDRARSVAKALAERGMSENVKVEWHGERKPRIDTPDETREQENRRVEILPGAAPGS